MRLLLLISLVLLASCKSSVPEEDPVDRARYDSSRGEYELALKALREATRAQPDDADTRLLLAEVYLDLGQGALALSTVEQAIGRGLDPDRAVLHRARGLFIEQRWNELISLTVPKTLQVGEHAKLLYLQAEARANQSAHVDGSDDDAVRAYIDLYHFIELQTPEPEVAALAEILSAQRMNRDDIDRAWQHYSCAKKPSSSNVWRPIESSGSRVLHVGPDRELTTIAEAASAARDGDVVEIDSGTYRGGIALWPQNDIVVRGVGERPIITADGLSIRQRDVWLFTGDDVVVENVDISGARSPWENGAGIRHTGSGLTLRHVFLHDNENGVLTSNRYPDTGQILIEYSEFSNNGDNKGLAHNIYIGRSKRFELRYSYSHETKAGHLVKSRAQENLITYNRLTDEEDGQSSYIIDIPEGGIATIVGNVIEQGPATLNHGMISFAGESASHLDNTLSVVNNSIYNRDFDGVVVRNNKDLAVVMANNLLGGAPVVTTDSIAELINNLTRPEHGMADPRNYDYSLIAAAPGVDTGIDFDIKPTREYVHPVQWRLRQNVWRLDVGAYERCGID